jgi:probable rRNA maturation factor
MVAKINLINHSGRRLPAAFVKTADQLLARAIKLTGRNLAELTIIMVTPQRMKQLNYTYRRRAKVTDVLSFNYANSKGLSGEIFICLTQALKQAKHFGETITEELNFLFIHGCLHILGYDHIKRAERQQMEKLEESILDL